MSAGPTDLLNPNLLFATAWFWTLPEVHRVEREIEALTNLFRRSIGMERESGEIPTAPAMPELPSR